MSYDIRKATLNDIPQILEIIELVVSLMQADGNYQWSETYPGEKDFINDISNEVLWVASTEQGDIHGCIAITMQQGEDYGAVWDISQKAVVPHRLAVHPKAQGKGLAKLLLSQAEEIAKTNGCLSVRIDTNTMNKATNHLFPILGYKFVGEIGLTGRDPLRFNCFEKYI